MARPQKTRVTILVFVLLAQLVGCATTPRRVSLPARCQEKASAAKPSSVPSPEAEDEAALNGKRWQRARYFKGMKEKVAGQWKPAEAYQRYDPDGSVAAGKLLTTELEVTLSPDGSLDRVSVHRSAGLDLLDRTAVEAFQNAQPFGEPPCALLQDAGRIRFRFGFVFDTRRLLTSVSEPLPSQ
jgi:TonB family protein